MAKKKKFNFLTALTGLSFETEEAHLEADTATDDLIAKLAAKANAEGKSLTMEKGVAQTPPPRAEQRLPEEQPNKVEQPNRVEQSIGEQEARQQRSSVTEEIMKFLMEEVNQEGADFAEFLERLDSIRQITVGSNMGDEQIYKMAHLEFKGQVKRTYLLSTAKFYQNALKSTFFENAKKELKNLYSKEVKGFKEKAENLRKSNQGLEKKIDQLQQEMADNIKKAGELEAKAAQQDISLQHKKAAYESVIPVIMGQIAEVAGKIKQYIEPDGDEKNTSEDV